MSKRITIATMTIHGEPFGDFDDVPVSIVLTGHRYEVIFDGEVAETFSTDELPKAFALLAEIGSVVTSERQ